MLAPELDVRVLAAPKLKTSSASDSEAHQSAS
jgi:hypothetical protein